MADKQRTFREKDKENFVMLGPLTSGGLTYRVSPLTEEKNELKNSFNTDIAREMGTAKESEDWGTVLEDNDKKKDH